LKVFSTMGASTHSKQEREMNDYYATDPKAVEGLLQVESFQNKIWEPFCGEGHISKLLESKGFDVYSSDLIDRGFGDTGKNFFFFSDITDRDIISNPPYGMAQDCIEHALMLMQTGRKMAMFLKISFLEGKSRKKLFEDNPPIRIWVSSSRFLCGKNGDFAYKQGSAVAYAWFIWEKGFKGDTIVKWFN